MSRADELEAEGHEKIAEGHALLARARRERAPAVAPAEEWVAPDASPLGKRRTLALARSGALESSKVGRRVLIRRTSLDAYLRRHERGVEEREEDLFGVAS